MVDTGERGELADFSSATRLAVDDEGRAGAAGVEVAASEPAPAAVAAAEALALFVLVPFGGSGVSSGPDAAALAVAFRLLMASAFLLRLST